MKIEITPDPEILKQIEVYKSVLKVLKEQQKILDKFGILKQISIKNTSPAS